MSDIKIIHASEGNLKDISLTIPKNKLVVFTGLSGSGKSTLLIDVLFNECQRQYLEAMSMQGIHKPHVERIQGVSPAILITQTDMNKNPRSTVGTMSDVYTDLRMIYEKLGIRQCPYCGKMISSADCQEETEKINNDFHVSMYCHECGRRMDKITRTSFSFNTKEGACPTCSGLGIIHSIQKDKVVDESLSLENGAVQYWEQQYKNYQISILYKAYEYYHIIIPKNIPVYQFNKLQKAILYDGIKSTLVQQTYPSQKPPQGTSEGKFEGVLPTLWRRLMEKDGQIKKLQDYFEITECPDCHGERLSEQSRHVTVLKTRLPELSQYSLDRLYQWIENLSSSLSKQHADLVADYLLDIKIKLSRYIKVGLGYLTLDRQVMSLSGGELQRLRLAAILDSDLSGIIYILDEPTVGLHPKDTDGLITILKKLRDQGNSVYVIEHDVDIMSHADYIVDMGPGAGQYGGEVIAMGTFNEILHQPLSVSGQYLLEPHPMKTNFRIANGFIHIKDAHQFNLQHIDVDIPCGCLTTITGPSGSGKSTLIFEVLAKQLGVTGLAQFDNIVTIEQSPITKMKRSNVVTYSGVYAEIRNVFAKTEAAKALCLTTKSFSFNTVGGRCENCEGLGYVDNNLLFFTNNEIVCPVCHGQQFHEDVLSVKYNGYSIKDVLDLSIDEAILFFKDHHKILRTLKLLQDVGLTYLKLGQSVKTLSGGEAQRLKLAKELIDNHCKKTTLYLMDEPTTGLHPRDVDHFLILLNHLVHAGHSVIVVEHNQQLIRNSDWVIDLGPYGGAEGGEIIFSGTPKELLNNKQSITAKYLRRDRGNKDA